MKFKLILSGIIGNLLDAFYFPGRQPALA